MADVVRFVYPSIGTVGVSSQTVTQMIPQPKISFVYPSVGGPTNIQPRLNGNVNQQVDNTLGSQNIIFVTMDTPNLQQIQSFPVVSRQGDVHIHQDPMTGQLYQMTDQIHQNIVTLDQNNFARNLNVSDGQTLITPLEVLIPTQYVEATSEVLLENISENPLLDVYDFDKITFDPLFQYLNYEDNTKEVIIGS